MERIKVLRRHLIRTLSNTKYLKRIVLDFDSEIVTKII